MIQFSIQSALFMELLDSIRKTSKPNFIETQ